MRLSTEKIKAAILDPDSRCERRPSTISPRPTLRSEPDVARHPGIRAVWQRCLRHGFSFLDDSRADRRVDRLALPADRPDRSRPADETASDLFTDLVDAFRHADEALLERHAATIRQVRQLDEETKTVISNRIQLVSLDPQALWQRLIEFCQAQDRRTQEDRCSDYEFGCAIVDALARYPDQFAGEVLKILERETGGDWLEIMAVRLAGVMRVGRGDRRLDRSLG